MLPSNGPVSAAAVPTKASDSEPTNPGCQQQTLLGGHGNQSRTPWRRDNRRNLACYQSPSAPAKNVDMRKPDLLWVCLIVASWLTRYLMLDTCDNARALMDTYLKVGGGKRIETERSRSEGRKHSGLINETTPKVDELKIISIQRGQAIHVIAQQSLGQLGFDRAKCSRRVTFLAHCADGLSFGQASTGQVHKERDDHNLHSTLLVGGPPNVI